MPAGAGEPAAERVAAAAVDLAHLGGIVGRLAQRHDRGDLDRLEGAVVEVRLELRERARRRRRGRARSRRASPPSRTTSSGCRARPRSRARPSAAGATAARGRRRRCRRRRSRGRAGSSCSRARSTSRCSSARVATAVVGLCGNETMTTRGRGACTAVLDRVDRRPRSRGVHDRRAGETRRDEVDRVAGRRHDDGVARLDQHPHQVREALLGADRARRPASRGRA